ncbi:MAG: hypothetical protein ACRBCJ_10420 [Hyphomicrobiaceae bacterium]
MTGDERPNGDSEASASTPRAVEAAKRKVRLEAEMRANLQKRKQQIRSRKAKTKTTGRGNES